MLLIAGNELQDFCLYYSLSRMKENVYWLPISFRNQFITNKDVENTQSASPKIMEAEAYIYLLMFIESQLRFRSIRLISSSISYSELEELKRGIAEDSKQNLGYEINVIVAQVSSAKELIPHVRKIYEKDNLYKQYRDQFHNGVSLNFIDTPKPKHLREVPPHGLHWITEVGIENYQLPNLARFGPETIIQKNYGTDEVRTTKEGFAYFCPYIAYFGGDIDAVLVKPRIHIFEPFTIFQRHFAFGGYEVQNSDKGNYHNETVVRFGSLSEFADFIRDSSNRELFNLFKDSTEYKDKEGNFVKDRGFYLKDRRRYLDFVSIYKIYGDEEKTIQQIQDLIERSILYRGYIFQCSVCRQYAWYSLEGIGQQFKCARCGRTQTFHKEHWKSTPEPHWFYKLDEVVYQCYDNDCHVPILALDYLKKKSKRSFFYAPEIEVLSSQEPKKVELDICCCVDGEVVIGEAKIASILANTAKEEKRMLSKYIEIAKAINARTIVLSTFSEAWNDKTLNYAQSILKGKQMLFLTKSDLLK